MMYSIGYSKRNCNLKGRKETMQLIRSLSSFKEEIVPDNEYTVDNCIQILRKRLPKSLKEIKIISFFLKRSELSKVLKENKIDEEGCDKLIYLWSTLIFILKCKVNETIISIGKEIDKMRIFFIGEIEIVNEERTLKDLSGYDYFKLLVHMTKKCEENPNDELSRKLLSKTILENNNIYKIQETQVKILRFIVFRILFNNAINKRITQKESYDYYLSCILSNIIEMSLLKPKDLEISYKIQTGYLDKIIFEIEHFYTKNYKHLTIDYLLPFLNLIQTDNNSKLVIYGCKHTIISSEKEFSGIFIGKNKKKISEENIIARKESYFLSLPFEIFHQYIEIEKDNIFKKTFSFFKSVGIFEGYSNNFKLKHTYFPKMQLMDFERGNILFKQGDAELNQILIIKNGEVKLSIKTKTPQDTLQYLISFYEEYLNGKPIDYDNNELNNLIKAHNCQKPITLPIMTLKDLNYYGVVNCYYNIRNFYTIEVVSDKAQIYYFDVREFKEMLQGMENFRIYIDKIAKLKIEYMIERLNNIFNYYPHSYIEYFNSQNEINEISKNNNKGNKIGKEERKNKFFYRKRNIKPECKSSKVIHSKKQTVKIKISNSLKHYHVNKMENCKFLDNSFLSHDNKISSLSPDNKKHFFISKEDIRIINSYNTKPHFTYLNIIPKKRKSLLKNKLTLEDRMIKKLKIMRKSYINNYISKKFITSPIGKDKNNLNGIISLSMISSMANIKSLDIKEKQNDLYSSTISNKLRNSILNHKLGIYSFKKSSHRSKESNAFNNLNSKVSSFNANKAESVLIF